MPVSWKRQAAVITTSASRFPIRGSETISGLTPARVSGRNSRSAMFTTIWMCTHEWSEMSSRSAFTCCMCHQAWRRASWRAAAKSASSRRLPRVGARISIGGRSTRVPFQIMVREPLIDGHGRRISDLRVSVTDRCNFRCQYCMPADGLPWLDRDEILTFEEIERVVRVLAEMGVTDLRLTGGEPLVRREFPRLVAMRGFTEEEALPFAEFARSTSYQVRFIEFMPLDGDHAWSRDQVLTGKEIRAIIDRVHPLEERPREPHATARVFRFRDGRGEIGFINPVSEHFCADSDRIRLTDDGKLRTCLFSLHETDLRGPLRAGASDDELERIVRRAVWRKELKHQVGEKGFRQPYRTMSAIGG